MAESIRNSWPSSWGASAPTLLTETFSSRIWKVSLADGSPAIVKALKDFPDVWDEQRGGYYLQWRDGAGGVKLLGWQGRDMLLEYGGEKLLTDVIASEGDDAATEIVADALKRLLAPSDRPAPSQLQPLRERFAALFERGRHGAGNQHDPIYAQAANLADQLLGDTIRAVPLHGDLHHENLINGPRGWLIIDPKGVFGDPAFDAANLFYNPLELRKTLCRDERRIAQMAQTFAGAVGRSSARILDFAICYGCLSASWHGEDGDREEEELELAVAYAVRKVRAIF